MRRRKIRYAYKQSGDTVPKVKSIKLQMKEDNTIFMSCDDNDIIVSVPVPKYEFTERTRFLYAGTLEAIGRIIDTSELTSIYAPGTEHFAVSLLISHLA